MNNWLLCTASFHYVQGLKIENELFLDLTWWHKRLFITGNAGSKLHFYLPGFSVKAWMSSHSCWFINYGPKRLEWSLMIFKHGMWLSNISSTIQVQILLWPIRMVVLRGIKLTFHTWTLLGKKDMGYYVKRKEQNPYAGFCTLFPSSSSSSFKSHLPLQLFFSLSLSPYSDSWPSITTPFLMWPNIVETHPVVLVFLVSEVEETETAPRK